MNNTPWSRLAISLALFAFVLADAAVPPGYTQLTPLGGSDNCIAALNDDPAEIRFTGDGRSFTHVWLEWVSGDLACFSSFPRVRWGCDPGDGSGSGNSWIITTDSSNALIADAATGGTSAAWTLPSGQTYHSDDIGPIVLAEPFNTTDGATEEIRFWYTEDINNNADSNNVGATCVNVYVLYGVATENPLRCGEYDEVNERYFYDDGTGCETTPTVNDACYYGVDELATSDAATLRVDLSELKADGGEDYIYLAFDLADKYYNNELVFADAAIGECEHADWELVSATRNVASLDACETTFVYRLLWSDAYNATDSKCGWERDTSGANVKLVLDFAVRADEDLTAMRNGTVLTRTSVFAMPVQVEFPVQVTADTENVQVFAPVRVIAAIVGQAVTIDESTSPDTATLTLRLSTEVQAPFELHAITSVSHPGDVTLATTLDGGNDVNVRKDAECTNSSLDCGNEWEWTYTTQTTTEPCDFDGAYSVSFTIRCSNDSDTDCPIDAATDSVTISFNVDSSDHCPKVIDSIVLSAALEVFDAPQRAVGADDFVGDGLQDDGQTAVNEGDADQWQVAYFTAPTTSTQVALDTTEFNQVWIIRGDASKVVLLDKDGVHGGAVTCTATAYADADNTASCGTEAGLDDTTCQLIVPDVAFPDKCGAFDFAHRPGTSADAGAESTPWFEFDVNTGASGFNMADDAIETMTVHAVIDVTYTNAAKREAGSVQETRADFATVTAPLTAGTATPSSGTSSSSALFGMNATVLYGAGAFLVVGVLAVLVVVSRRRSAKAGKMEKMESTAELTSTNAV